MIILKTKLKEENWTENVLVLKKSNHSKIYFYNYFKSKKV